MQFLGYSWWLPGCAMSVSRVFLGGCQGGDMQFLGYSCGCQGGDMPFLGVGKGCCCAFVKCFVCCCFFILPCCYAVLGSRFLVA